MLWKLGRRYQDLKLKYKLMLAFCILIAVAVSLTAMVVSFFSGDAIAHITSDYSASLISQMSLNIALPFQSIEQSLFDKYADAVFQADLISLRPEADQQFSQRRRINSRVSYILNSSPALEFVMIHVLQGQSFSTRRSTVRTLPAFDMEEEKALLYPLRGACVWTRGEDGMLYLKRSIVSLSTTQNMGVIIAGVKEEYIAQLCFEYISQTAAMGNIVLLDGNNQLLLASRETDVDLIDAALAGQADTHTRTIVHRRERHQVNQKPVKGTNWHLLQIVPVVALTAQLLPIHYAALAACIAMLCMSWVVALLVANNSLKGIDELMESTDKMASGDFEQELRPQGRGEIGQLSEKFELMRRRIIVLTQERVQQEREMEKSRHQMLVFKYRALQAQMNPHFLYNTLDAIASMAQMNHQQEITDLVCTLSSLLRESIGSQPRMGTVREEIQYIKKYTSIYACIYEESMRFKYEIAEEAFPCRLPRFLLQPLVENAIVHGIGGKMGMGVICIRAYLQGSRLIIEVEDNGIGFDPKPVLARAGLDMAEGMEGKEGHTSLGIPAVLECIHRECGAEYGLHIESVIGTGTKVALYLPRSA